MLGLGAKVSVNLEPLKSFATALQADLRSGTSGPIKTALKQWAARYRSFAMERFDIFSKGGGDWPKLSERTKRARKRKGSIRGKGGRKGGIKPTRLKFKKPKPPKIKSFVDGGKNKAGPDGVYINRSRAGKNSHLIRKLYKKMRTAKNTTAGAKANLKHSERISKTRKKFRKFKVGEARKKFALKKLAKRAAYGKKVQVAYKKHKRNIAALKKRNARIFKRLKFAILKDMGTLFAVLSPVFTAKPGQLEQQIPFGVRVGYGGPAIHQTAKGSGHTTIADIASFHNDGAPDRHLPQRLIIVAPPSNVVTAMTGDMSRALKKLATITGNDTPDTVQGP